MDLKITEDEIILPDINSGDMIYFPNNNGFLIGEDNGYYHSVYLQNGHIFKSSNGRLETLLQHLIKENGNTYTVYKKNLWQFKLEKK